MKHTVIYKDEVCTIYKQEWNTYYIPEQNKTISAWFQIHIFYKLTEEEIKNRTTNDDDTYKRLSIEEALQSNIPDKFKRKLMFTMDMNSLDNI